MNDADAQRIARLLEEIRDDQRTQLERQAEALGVQREQAEMARRQFARADKLHGRVVVLDIAFAEAIQARSSQLVGAARRLVLVAVPVILLLLVYVSWLLFRR